MYRSTPTGHCNVHNQLAWNWFLLQIIISGDQDTDDNVFDISIFESIGSRMHRCCFSVTK